MSFLKNFASKKKIWIPTIVALIIIGGTGFWLLNSGMISFGKKTAVEASPSYQTSLVRKGDLTITATGTGSLVAGKSVDLSFSTEGIVQELNVKAGDKVTKGMKLASMNNAKTLEAQVAANELNVLQAQKNSMIFRAPKMSIWRKLIRLSLLPNRHMMRQKKSCNEKIMPVAVIL
jgi:multidrug efflux pump subunit AcrA (membrane-fusion protein)